MCVCVGGGGGRERSQHQHLCLVIGFGQYESGVEAWGQSTVRLAPGCVCVCVGGGGGGLPSSPVALLLYPPISPY